ERQEHAPRRRRRRQSPQHTVHVEREAGRGLARAVRARRLVAPAAPQLTAHALGKDDEGDAGLVLKAAVLDRIDGEARGWRRAANQLGDLRKTIELGGGGRRQVKLGQRRQRLVGGPRGAQQRLEQGVVWSGEVAHRRGVLAVERKA